MSYIENEISYQLNAIAVSLLENRMYSEAASTLRQAISLLKSRIASNYNNDQGSFNKCAHGKMILHHSKHILLCRNIDTHAECKSNVSSPHNYFELYAYAFELSQTLFCQGPLAHELIRSVALYNLGLSFHLYAVETNSSHHFKAALRFYSMSYDNSYRIRKHLYESPIRSAQHKIGHGPRNNPHYVADVSLFLLSLLNNMSHIQSHLFDNSGIQRNLTELRYILVLAKQDLASLECHALIDSLIVRVNGNVAAPQAAAA
jgi:hypothetical protein